MLTSSVVATLSFIESGLPFRATFMPTFSDMALDILGILKKVAVSVENFIDALIPLFQHSDSSINKYSTLTCSHRISRTKLHLKRGSTLKTFYKIMKSKA